MSSENVHQPGDGADLSVTEARAGVRRGVSKILWLSTGLALAGFIAAWIFVPHHAPPAPASAKAPAASSQPLPPTG